MYRDVSIGANILLGRLSIWRTPTFSPPCDTDAKRKFRRSHPTYRMVKINRYTNMLKQLKKNETKLIISHLHTKKIPINNPVTVKSRELHLCPASYLDSVIA